MAWNLEEAIAYYRKQGAPADQNALVSLLREIQQESGGGISGYQVTAVAEAYGIRESLLLVLVKRMPSLRLSDTHSLQLCAGPNCGKAAALAACAEKLCNASGGKVKLEFVNCMRMCGKGPNIKWDGKLCHGTTVERLQEFFDAVKEK